MQLNVHRCFPMDTCSSNSVRFTSQAHTSAFVCSRAHKNMRKFLGALVCWSVHARSGKAWKRVNGDGWDLWMF